MDIPHAGRHPRPSNRPHVSVAVRSEAGEPWPLRSAALRLPITVRIGGLLLFPHGDRAVLARAVVADAELLDFHAEVHRLTIAWGDALPTSSPGAWSPHLTLARRLRREDVPRAVEALAPPPERLVLDRLRVWDGHRHEVIGLYPSESV
ncbi:MAG: 2'-5' RNA ligase family protein [Micrococcales bacterium]|nr:2'-5' RNA ligase family protein [Micrococcales bacterium]